EALNYTRSRNSSGFGSIARAFAIAIAVAFLPARLSMADPDDFQQQILPFPILTESTIPTTNGDVNPYGVAFVPNGFPAGGLLTGLAYDAQRDILYVASTGDNEVFAVRDAGQARQSVGLGQLIYQDPVHLHGALAMVLAPNGHLLVSNSDGINPDPDQPSEIVEFTVHGEFIGQLSVDPNEGGAFGLNIVKVGDDVVRFAAVDDNANTITLWKLNTANLTDHAR